MSKEPENEEKITYCMACGEVLTWSSMLVCVGCLNQECDKFSKKAKFILSKEKITK